MAGVAGVAAVVDDAVGAERVEGLLASDQAVVVLAQQQLHFVSVGLALGPSQRNQVRVEAALHLRLGEGIDDDTEGGRFCSKTSMSKTSKEFVRSNMLKSSPVSLRV